MRYIGVSPNEPYKNNIGVKMGSWFMKYDKPTNVILDVKAFGTDNTFKISEKADVDFIINLLKNSKYINEPCDGIANYAITYDNYTYDILIDCSEIKRGNKQAKTTDKDMEELEKILVNAEDKRRVFVYEESVEQMFFVINNIKICSINPHEADYVYELIRDKYNSENVDICILDYDYVTGASWGVEKSTNKDIENKYVCLNTICNPRLLKINNEFDLDHMAKYVVVIDKNISRANIDDEDVNILKAKEIVITNFYYQNEGFDDIRFCDLTFAGKLKSIIALFVPKFRLQM